ncbi:MAG: glycoside hydrolase family 65 protein, partial [Planctomycetota bacterium]
MTTWTFEWKGFEPAEEGLREALSTLGNGFFCSRGALPFVDADPDVHYPGTYVHGGYNRLVTPIAGRPVENEDLVNLPNPFVLKPRIDGGDFLDLGAVEI